MTKKAAADDEKLGPIGPILSVWELDARGIIVSAFRAATGQAAAAAGTASEDLAKSVHEFRKSLRRAGAVLALVRPVLRNQEFAAIRAELRTARRAVSAARDHTVAIASLDSLMLEPEERLIADGLLGVLREHGPVPAEISAQMADGAQRVSVQANALEAALAPELDWSTIAKGFGRTYRAARQARRGAKRSRQAFHRWRRRAKELDAQLTLITAHGGERSNELHQSYEQISNLLGPIADLLMLQELIEAHGKAADHDQFDVLIDGLDRLADERIRDARKAAKPLFARRPAEMAKKLSKAIRKDANPAPAQVEGDDPGDSHDD